MIEVKVKVGDRVKAGDEILVLEAMKMENAITTDYAGEVKQALRQRRSECTYGCSAGRHRLIAFLSRRLKIRPQHLLRADFSCTFQKMDVLSA